MAGSATKGARHAQPGARKIPAWVPDACTPTRSFPCCAARGAGVQTTPRIRTHLATSRTSGRKETGRWPATLRLAGNIYRDDVLMRLDPL